MPTKNCVYIATSLDGFIADRNNGLEWLEAIPIPEGMDMGYTPFMESVDALVMGRTTFEMVCGFDVPWPYQKPVFVLSNSLSEIPSSHKDKAHLMKGPLSNILRQIHSKGYHNLYIDGGRTIQSFLREDLIDEMTITTMPVLLGGGIPLFGDLAIQLNFDCLGSEVFLDKIVQTHYRRVRS